MVQSVQTTSLPDTKASLKEKLRLAHNNSPFKDLLLDKLCEMLPDTTLNESALPLMEFKLHGPLTVRLITKHRTGASKFFYEMLVQWLLPGKKLNIVHFYSADFTLGSGPNLLFAEAILHIDDRESRVKLERNISTIEREIALGLPSPYHARRILEMKGLSVDQKTALIQERMTDLIRRFPALYDYDIFSVMHHVLVHSSDSFKEERDAGQVSHILSSLYLMKKQLEERVMDLPHKRHLMVKLKQMRLNIPFRTKSSLGVLVGLNLLKENEVFASRHIHKAAASLIEDLEVLEETEFTLHDEETHLHLVYIELEKKSGEPFSLPERALLKRELPRRLQGRIEHLMRPIFMPRNEEEVMRNIVSLSQELKYVRDLPQIMISFEEQNEHELAFTVVLTRIRSDKSPTLDEKALKENEHVSFTIEKRKEMGRLRNRYPKEAYILRASLSISPYLREDQSVDLFQARQAVVQELQHHFGEVRDYNGGMISKQTEAFTRLKQQLSPLSRDEAFWMENYFHALYPIEYRCVANPDLLAQHFRMFFQLIQGGEDKSHISHSTEAVFVVCRLHREEEQSRITQTMMEKYPLSPSMMLLQHPMEGIYYLGYIYSGEDKESFIAEIQSQFRTL